MIKNYRSSQYSNENQLVLEASLPVIHTNHSLSSACFRALTSSFFYRPFFRRPEYLLIRTSGPFSLPSALSATALTMGSMPRERQTERPGSASTPQRGPTGKKTVSPPLFPTRSKIPKLGSASRAKMIPCLLLDGHAKPLTSDEKELLKKWIQEGAEYEDFWAFVPAKKQEVPAVLLMIAGPSQTPTSSFSPKSRRKGNRLMKKPIIAPSFAGFHSTSQAYPRP